MNLSLFPPLLVSLCIRAQLPQPFVALRLPVAYDAPAHTVSPALNAGSPLLPKSLKEEEKKPVQQQQQEEEEAEKGGRRKREVEILREAEGKKGGSPVTAVKSPPPPLHLSSSFSLTSPLFPPSLAHNPLPTSPSTPLRRAQQHLSFWEHCASLELDPARRDLDEGHFAGGRTGTSL